MDQFLDTLREINSLIGVETNKADGVQEIDK